MIRLWRNGEEQDAWVACMQPLFEELGDRADMVMKCSGLYPLSFGLLHARGAVNTYLQSIQAKGIDWVGVICSRAAKITDTAVSKIAERMK